MRCARAPVPQHTFSHTSSLKFSFHLLLRLHRPLYEGFKALREGPAWGSLSKGQQRVVDSELRDFVLGGVALEGKEKERWV